MVHNLLWIQFTARQKDQYTNMKGTHKFYLGITMKSLIIGTGLVLFILTAKPTFDKWAGSNAVVTSSTKQMPDGMMSIPTIVLCYYTAFTGNSFGSVQDYLDKTLDPWKFILGVRPNDTTLWEFRTLSTSFRGRCASIKYKQKV